MVARVKRYVASHAEGRAVILPLQSHEQLFVVHAFLVSKPIACINDASNLLALLEAIALLEDVKVAWQASNA